MADITMFRGDTAAKPISLTNAETGAAIPLTGLTLTITANRNVDPVDATGQVFSKPMTITDATGGLAEFTLTDVDWGSIGAGVYQIDVQAVDGASAKQTLFKGTLEIVQDINKG